MQWDQMAAQQRGNMMTAEMRINGHTKVPLATVPIIRRVAVII